MIEQAVILAGGRGERLRPYTQDRPKCMIEIMGNPMLSYQLHWLRSYGIKEVVIACGYLHEMVEDYFGDGTKWNLEISYSIEDQPLGRGGALKAALQKLKPSEAPVIVLNGDHLSNVSIKDLLAFHQKHTAIATLVTVPLRSPYGIVETTKQGTVTGFREKPELPYGINAGIYLMEKTILECLPDIGDHEEHTFPGLARKGSLKAFQTRAFWRTVDTVKDLSELKQELEKLFFGTLFQPPPVAESNPNQNRKKLSV